MNLKVVLLDDMRIFVSFSRVTVALDSDLTELIVLFLTFKRFEGHFEVDFTSSFKDVQSIEDFLAG